MSSVLQTQRRQCWVLLGGGIDRQLLMDLQLQMMARVHALLDQCWHD